MNLLQLDQILTKLCVELKIQTGVTATFEISASDKVYAGIFWGNEYPSQHSITMERCDNYSHIYWSLAYKSIKEGIIEIEKAEEIYNQFKLHKQTA